MKNLYLTAVLPPSQLSEQIDDIRKECAEQFDVKAALKPPVHITLFRPFFLEAEREMQLIRLLRPITYNHQPFKIVCENFDTFNSQVVFIRVLKSEALGNLQREVAGIYNRNKIDPREVKGNTAFHPHITIAYRDIPAPVFPKLWSVYKNRKFKRSFTIDRFTLLKHDGKKWQPFQEFYFKKQKEVSLFG